LTRIKDDAEGDLNPVVWSDSAHVGLTPMPMINNPMASVCAAITNTLATVV